MTLVFEILGVLVLAFFVLLVAVLVMPVRIVGRGSGDTGVGFEVSGRVMPFAGLCGIGFRHDGCAARMELYLVRWRVAEFDIRAGAEKMGRLSRLFPKRKKAPKPKVKEKKSTVERVRSLLGKGKTMRPLLLRAIRELVRLVHFDRFRADIRFGLGDPAFTGMLAGIIYTINGVLPASCTVTPSWDFTRVAAGGDIDMDITILNYRFWGALVRLMPDVLRMRRTLAGATS